MATIAGAARASHPVNSFTPGARVVHCSFTTSTAGAIVASSVKFTGGTVTKTGGQTGRYTIQFGSGVDKNTYVRLDQFIGSIVGPASVAFTAAKGLTCEARTDVNLSTTGAIDIQWLRTDTYADTEVQDGAKVLLTFWLATEKYR